MPRNEAEGESTANYVAELQRMSANSEYCKFPDQTLRDRFIAGLKSQGLQRQILSEEKLTFAQAVQKAKAIEAAEMNSKALKYHEPMTVKKLAPASPWFHCEKVTIYQKNVDSGMSPVIAAVEHLSRLQVQSMCIQPN